MATTDDTSKKRPARTTTTRNSAASRVSAETETPRSSTVTRLEQTLDTERRRLLHVRGVLHCLYEVLLYADGEDAVLYAEAAHLASIMIDDPKGELPCFLGKLRRAVSPAMCATAPTNRTAQRSLVQCFMNFSRTIVSI